MSKTKKKQVMKTANQKPQEKSRKLIRKEKRLEKKNRRIEYHAKKVLISKGKSILGDTAKLKTVEPVTRGNTEKKAKKELPTEEISDNIHKELKQKEKLQAQMAKQRRAQLRAANEEEDREIKRLEKLLKLDKRKKKQNIPKSFYADNLGILLEVCDRDYMKKLAETEKTIQDSGSEFEEDFAAVTGKKILKKRKDSSSKQDEETDLSDDEFDDSDDCSDGNESKEDDLEQKKTGKSAQRPVVSEKRKSRKSLTDSVEDDSDEEILDMKKKIDKGSKKGKEAAKQSKNKRSEDNSDDEEGFSDLDVSDHFDDSDFGLGADDGTGSEQGDAGSDDEQGEEEDDLGDEDDDLGVEDDDEVSDEEDDDFGDEEEEDDFGDEEDDDPDDEGDEHSGSEESIDNSVVEMNKNRKRVHFLDENLDAKKLKTEEKIHSQGKKQSAVKIEKKAEEKVKNLPVKEGKKKLQNLEEDADFDDDMDDDDFDDDFGDDFGDDETKDKPKGAAKKNADGTWEDIYGRLRNSTGDVVDEKPTKYVPPHLRGETSDSKKKELERLRRQMKGLMNRLAENNMASISSQLDEMYMTNSRYDMNNTLTSLTLEALVSPVLTPDRLVMEHCLLIALLHANVGSEVGAHFLQAVVQKFDQSLGNEEVEDKTLDNLVHIVSHLYNFKIFSASLIFSILDKVAETLNEKRVDLLLLILRTVGSTLRKDDPVALKNLVVRLQTKAVGTPELQKSSRVKFMLEVLLAIKNNNMMKIPNYNPETIEHAKKLLRTLIRRGKYVTELNISLEDLLKADERGRWWIVGSAWTGHLPGESNPSDKNDLRKESKGETSGGFNTELLELARNQRMNTDTRRNIFCILLTAEDYLDAFEKLMHLNLKNQQEHEIIHVLLDCALQEKSFNPYYSHLAQKFCDFDRKYQMKIQYAVWDKLKELSSLQSFQISNLARLLSHLFLEKGLPISILKVVSFAEIDKTSVRLIRQILLGVLMVEDRNESEAVFLRVAPSPKLRLFREGLRLFIRHFMLRPSSTKVLSEQELDLLKERAAMAEKALSAAENELQF